MSSSKSSMSCLNPHCPSSSSAGSESKIISGKIDLRNIHQCSISKTAKLKKRKTKKQRDEARCKKLQVENAKKGSNGIFSQIQGLQHSLRVPPSSAFKVTYNSNPVIITKSRLSQHLGMFNREVKSIDIERLLSKANEKAIAENDCQNNTSQIEKENTVQGDNIHTHLCAADTEVNVNEEVAFLNCKEQNLLRGREHVNNVLLSEERQNSTPGSQGTDTNPITIFLHSDKESHMPSSSRMNVPVLEVAEKIFRKLHNQVLFPGRNLVSETQKSIMAKRVQMKNISLITSAQKKLDCSTKDYTNICQGTDWKYTSSEAIDYRKSRLVPQGINKKQRTPAQFVLTSKEISAQTVVKMIPDSQGREELTELCNQPVFNGLNECRLKFPKEHYNVHKYVSPNDHPELIWDNRSRLQRNTEAFRQAMRQSNSQKYEAANSPSHICKYTHNSSQTFPFVHIPRQHKTKQSISQKELEISKQEGFIKSPLQEIIPELVMQSGLRMRQTAPDDQHTSFDVLKNIWSNDIQSLSFSKRRKFCLDVTPHGTSLCYKELGPQKAHTKSHHQSYQILSEGVDSLTDFGPRKFQDEDLTKNISLECRHLRNLGKHINHREVGTTLHDVILPSSNLSSWNDVPEFNVRSPVSSLTINNIPKATMNNLWNSQELSYPVTQSELCVDDQWQRVTSVFPNFEYTDQENSFITFPNREMLKQTLHDRSSPEAWIFPRMKLY